MTEIEILENDIKKLREELKLLFLKNEPKPTVFLSYGMHDVPEHKQMQTSHDLIKKALGLLGKEINQVSFITNKNCPGKPEDGRLHYLGHAIQLMDKCDYIIFADDWQEHKGCHIEHQAAELYGIEILSD